jgi:hypothetical protein
MIQLRQIEDHSKQSESVRTSLQTSLAELKAEHDKAMSELADEHARKMLEMEIAHAAKIAEVEVAAANQAEATALNGLKEEHERAMVVMAEEHNHRMQQMAESHAAHVADVEVAAIREAGSAAEEQAREHEAAIEAVAKRAEAAAERQAREHEAAIAALRAEHAEALRRQITLDGARERRSSSVSTTSSQSLTRGFGRRVDDEMDNPAGPETPLAYASDAEGRSPNQAYHDDHANAGSFSDEQFHLETLMQLQKENGALRMALRAVQDELISGKTPNVPLEDAHEAPESAFSQAPTDDPFRSPTTTTTHGEGASAFGGSRNEEYEDDEGRLTLEGTLESIRIQTEQLLEINDDFMAEQRRWSGRLGLRIDNYRTSPLRAES